MTELLQHSPDGLDRATKLLRVGGVVAFPTETVYGLGADGRSDTAVARIFAAKGRPTHNPLILHLGQAGDAVRWASRWPGAAARLAERFWPGPLTLVVPAATGLSSLALAGGDTVGLRVPDHPAALAMLRRCEFPVAAPSANRSGHVSPTTACHVLADLDGRIDAVLDGGPCDGGIESTVLDLTRSEPMILRPGLITPEMIGEELGIDPSTLITGSASAGVEGAGMLRSPGLLEQHYAPVIPLRLVGRSELALAPASAAVVWLGSAGEAMQEHQRVLPATPWGFASALYRTLRELEAIGASGIWMERIPETSHWWAVADRLRRASA